MITLFDMSVEEFLNQVGSSAPVPGGGAASIVSGLIGLYLIRMSATISANDAMEGPLAEFIGYLDQAAITLKENALEDMRLFHGYMAALKIPKGTHAEKQAREKALLDATLLASEAPLVPASVFLDVLTRTSANSILIKASIESDLFAGAALVHSAVNALLMNVDINIRPARMSEYREHFINKKHSIQLELASVIAQLDKRAREAGFSP